MDKTPNKYLVVSYKLYTVEDGKKQLEEMTHEDHPFEFISGFGVSLDAFEKNIIGLEKGSTFDFTLSKGEAFGDYDPVGQHKLAREMFVVNDRFDSDHIYEGAVITLMDDDERRFMARVVKVEDDGVTVDTNHPLAGKELNFTGEVIENREATNQEIQNMLNRLSGGCGGCGGGCDDGCGDCGGGCGGTDHKKGCGHCH
jgi:FKBP-type peptidyl-prolyl cis-trans isomerase SlyD